MLPTPWMGSPTSLKSSVRSSPPSPFTETSPRWSVRGLFGSASTSKHDDFKPQPNYLSPSRSSPKSASQGCNCGMMNKPKGDQAFTSPLGVDETGMAGEKQTKVGKKHHFRCDILATDATDFAAAEEECKQMIIEAAGTIKDDVEYLGGFVYELLEASDDNPLEDGDETLGGGYIRITPWSPFKAPQWNPLAMHPVGGHTDRTVLPREAAEPKNIRPRVQSWLDGLESDKVVGISPKYSVTRESPPPEVVEDQCG